MIKSFKIRLFPTPEQEELIWRHIGSCRFIWNWMLAKQQELYEQGEKHLSGFSMMNLLKPLKNDGEHEWLYEVSNASLQVVCRDLDKAYSGFFAKRSGFPKFKSRKKSKPNYPVRPDGMYFKTDGIVQIEKLGKVRFRTNYTFPTGKGTKFTNPRISYVNNKWILSFGMECENQAPVLSDKPMGIDLGVKELAVVSYGNDSLVFHNINKSKRVRELERKKKHIQRAIARKYRTNGNYGKTKGVEKYEAISRSIDYKLRCIRNNYIHQVTHKLVSMLPCGVVMEDLNVSGMMKNRHLSKAIANQCLSEFIRQMKYKCEWHGIPFQQVDRFYPSSKTCSCCGIIKRGLRLSDRTFICPECGFTIDRDLNAAINLMRYVATPEMATA